MVVYLYSLDSERMFASGDTVFTCQLLMPLISSILTLIVCIDGSLFRSFRYTVRLAYRSFMHL